MFSTVTASEHLPGQIKIINDSDLQLHPQAGRRRPWVPLQKEKHTKALTINHRESIKTISKKLSV